MAYTLAGTALLGLVGLDLCFSFVPLTTFRPELASSVRLSQESSTSNSGRRVNGGQKRSRAAAGVGPVQTTTKSKEEQESDVFDWLASKAGVEKMVSLGPVPGGGYRGLVTNSDVEEGQVWMKGYSLQLMYGSRSTAVLAMSPEPTEVGSFAYLLTTLLRCAVC